MTKTTYHEIADEMEEIAKLLAAAQVMTGTKTLDGLLIAKHYLDTAQERMDVLSERLDLKIKKEKK